MIYKKYGEVFKNLRLQKNFSQKELQELSGVSKATISQFENGKSMISYEKLTQVLDAMSLTIYDYSLLLNNGIPDYFITEFEQISAAFFNQDKENLGEIYEKNKRIGTIETYIIGLCAKATYSQLSLSEQHIIESVFISKPFWGLYELYVFLHTVEQIDINLLGNITESLFSEQYISQYIQKLHEYRALTINILMKVILVYIDQDKEDKAKDLLDRIPVFLVDADITSHMMIYFLEGYFTVKFKNKNTGQQMIEEVMHILGLIGAQKFKNVMEDTLVKIENQ